MFAWLLGAAIVYAVLVAIMIVSDDIHQKKSQKNKTL